MSATAAEFGIVGYTHAGGVDRPLVVWKGIGANPGVVVVPHTNWRGVFGKGTSSSGGTSTVAIEWPGFISTAYHAIMTNPTPTTNWMGSLIGGHRDPGGHMYIRNRYHDPRRVSSRRRTRSGSAAVGPPLEWTNVRGVAVSGTTAHLHRNDSYHEPDPRCPGIGRR